MSILDQHYSHGNIFDFIKQLRLNPKKLMVLGNELQKKSYFHVEDCVEAIYCAYNNSNKK